MEFVNHRDTENTEVAQRRKRRKRTKGTKIRTIYVLFVLLRLLCTITPAGFTPNKSIAGSNNLYEKDYR